MQIIKNKSKLKIGLAIFIFFAVIVIILCGLANSLFTSVIGADQFAGYGQSTDNNDVIIYFLGIGDLTKKPKSLSIIVNGLYTGPGNDRQSRSGIYSSNKQIAKDNFTSTLETTPPGSDGSLDLDNATDFVFSVNYISTVSNGTNTLKNSDYFFHLFLGNLKNKNNKIELFIFLSTVQTYTEAGGSFSNWIDNTSVRIYNPSSARSGFLSDPTQLRYNNYL